ncbi:MAG TPA: outer membrane beta-barrel protein, partial [Pseudomonadales bacterium]
MLTLMRPLLLALTALVGQALLAPPALGAAWYLDLGLGVNLAVDRTLNENGARVEFDLGAPIYDIALGYRFGERWRIEAELAYRNNDLETVSWPDGDTNFHQDSYDGVRSYSLMLNAIRSFRLGALQPYLGAGIGPSRVEWRMGTAPIGFGPNRRPREAVLDDETDTLALQFIAGFELPISERWGFAADYRLQHLPDFSLRDEAGERYDLKHTTHAAALHLSYLLSGRWTPAGKLPIPRQEGWYLGASLGAGFAVDSEVADSVENLDAFQTGPALSLSAGRTLSPHWRLELLYERRENKVEMVDFNPEIGQFPASGKVTASSLMLNAAYRFRPQKPVRPFVAAAAGGA